MSQLDYYADTLSRVFRKKGGATGNRLHYGYHWPSLYIIITSILMKSSLIQLIQYLIFNRGTTHAVTLGLHLNLQCKTFSPLVAVRVITQTQTLSTPAYMCNVCEHYHWWRMCFIVFFGSSLRCTMCGR